MKLYTTTVWLLFFVVAFLDFSFSSAREASSALSNLTVLNATTVTPETTTTRRRTTTESKELPSKEDAEEEHQSSLTIFFILVVLAICVGITHLLIQAKFHYLPESSAVVIVGAFIALLLKFFASRNVAHWEKEEVFPPNMFFLILLPPIIFESGYNLHKGNFFHNMGSALVFAIAGTTISALIVGGGVYVLGQADVAFQFSLVQSFAFGSLVSAVDPVATLAIFQAMDIDPVLYMLVFGESILNDAVAIVLTRTVLELSKPSMANVSGMMAVLHSVGRFCIVFVGSSLIGVIVGLLGAITLKFLDLRKTPSLELSIMFIFSYLPYGLAEGLECSGIMAILFAGIVMSHYAHHNLSPISQITVQQAFRTIAFMSETCVFAYLGLAIFSFAHVIKLSLVIWSIILILFGRALNIFPLSFILNYFRVHKITRRMQFIMWFSGLRGAIAFALSMNLTDFAPEVRRVLVTTTLIIVLFTILFLGGSTLPLMKFLGPDKKKKKKKSLTLSKTKGMGDALDSHSEHYTTEDEREQARQAVPADEQRGFLWLDQQYLVPFFTRKITREDMREGKDQLSALTLQWYTEVRTISGVDDQTEEEEEEDEEAEILTKRSGTSSRGPYTAYGGDGGRTGGGGGELQRTSYDKQYLGADTFKTMKNSSIMSDTSLSQSDHDYRHLSHNGGGRAVQTNNCNNAAPVPLHHHQYIGKMPLNPPPPPPPTTSATSAALKLRSPSSTGQLTTAPGFPQRADFESISGPDYIGPSPLAAPTRPSVLSKTLNNYTTSSATTLNTHSSKATVALGSSKSASKIHMNGDGGTSAARSGFSRLLQNYTESEGESGDVSNNRRDASGHGTAVTGPSPPTTGSSSPPVNLGFMLD